MTEEPSSLEALRAEIDAIDDGIQDLILRRAELAGRIRDAKTRDTQHGVFLRPGREAAVLRRLIGRHRGGFSPLALARIWREIFSTSVAMQGHFTLAVWMPERGAGYIELARNHFGAYTPATVHQSVGQVVQEVGESRATVGILPLPQVEDPQAWWPALMSSLPGTLRVVARLPVIGGRSGLEALAVAAIDPEASGGEDRSLLAVESNTGTSRTGLLDSLRQCGFQPMGVMDARSQGEDIRLTLVEVLGPVTRDDSRLASLTGHGGPIARAVVVGIYAEPFAPESLGAS